MRDSGLIVVKLGGSHIGSPELTAWLEVLADCGGRVILVPGGGPFADAVRAMQAEMRYSDAAAHHMALLAMEQFGQALMGLQSGFSMAGSMTAIHRVLRAGRVPIWSPAAMVLRAREIPASWDVTSDSLAAWLAGHMNVRTLWLVKHIGLLSDPVPAAELAARGIVDRAFPTFLAASGARAAVVPAEAHAAAALHLRNGGTPGLRIDLHAGGPGRLLSPPWPSSRRRVGDGR
jgi:dihydroneopterin aldolase